LNETKKRRDKKAGKNGDVKSLGKTLYGLSRTITSPLLHDLGKPKRQGKRRRVAKSDRRKWTRVRVTVEKRKKKSELEV